MEERKQISRRSFLGGAVVATLGSAGLGALTGCADSGRAGSPSEEAPSAYATEVPESWDRETEVLVLGAGIAGACAAVEAFDLGADLIVVDAAADITDCSCTLSGGWLCGVGTRLQEKDGIKDDIETFVADIRRDGGDAGDPDLIRVWGELSGETIDWLEDLGCDVQQRTFDAKLTAGSDSHSIARDYITNPAGNGLGWMEGLKGAIEERGIEVMASTKATRLYRDAGGRVVGAFVEAMDGSGTQNIKASKGVILAVGGLGRNLEAHQQYTPAMKSVAAEAETILFACSQNCLGLGYGMAKEVDAYLFNSPPTQGSSMQANADESKGWFPYIWCKDSGLIEVNLEGNRFYNETSFEEQYNDKVYQRQPKMTSVVIIDETTRTSDLGQTYVQPQLDMAIESACESTKSADSLEELAEAFGLPVDAVLEAVADFNARVDSQEPDEFGRVDFAQKIETPPFWGTRTCVNIGISKGGCRINEKAQVIDTKDRVIPGLYAAGEMAFAQLHGDARTHIVGGPNSSAACYGRIAARNATEEQVGE